MDYAIIRVGNKQHRVRDGETLVVDRVKTEAGKTFTPDVVLGDAGVQVTAKVVAHERGPKIRIGKYRRRTGYKRHTGFRAATSRLEITLGAGKKTAAAKPAPKAEEPKAPEAAAVKGMPSGYEDMTVAQVKDGSESWNRPMLEAALEAALAAKEES